MNFPCLQSILKNQDTQLHIFLILCALFHAWVVAGHCFPSLWPDHWQVWVGGMHWDPIGMQTQQICLAPGQFVGGGEVSWRWLEVRAGSWFSCKSVPPGGATVPVLSPRLIKRICAQQPNLAALCWPVQERETAAGKRRGGQKVAKYRSGGS